MLRFPVIFLFAGLLCSAQSAGSQPTPSNASGDATFHADTHEVLVDAVVTDKKGDVPRDLTARNFRLQEDGRPQNITSFSFTGSGDPGRSGRHFVALVFETDDPAFRQEAMRFVDKYAGPDLYVAVYSRVNREIHLVTPFTTSAARIKDALSSMQISAPGPTGLTYLDKNLLPHTITMENTGTVAAELAAVRGRKALVLFAPGMYTFDNRFMTRPDGTTVRASPNVNTPMDREVLQTVDECNQADVAVYSFTLATLPTESAQDWYRPDLDMEHYRQTNYARTTNRMRDLAVGTGGRYGNPGSNQLAEFLGSISTQLDDYYLLGYAPPVEAAAKNCHNLKVTVDRKDLDVDARDSYCASGMPQSLKPEQRALEARGGGGAPGNVATSMQATWFYLKRGVAVADVAMEIGPAALQIKGKLHAALPVLGVAYRGDGSVAARFGETVDLKFETQAQMDAALKTPLHYTNQIALPPGHYRLRVSAGTADKAFGSVEQLLDIAPWGGETLSASSIALGDHDYPISDATVSLDSSLLEGAYRLASRGREFVPMGRNQFRAGQEGLFYFEIYEPRLTAGGAGPAVKAPTIDLSIVDRATGEQKIDSGPTEIGAWVRPESAVIPVAMRLPSADLPPGAFTLEVRVTHDDGRDEVVRTVDFEVK